MLCLNCFSSVAVIAALTRSTQLGKRATGQDESWITEVPPHQFQRLLRPNLFGERQMGTSGSGTSMYGG